MSVNASDSQRVLAIAAGCIVFIVFIMVLYFWVFKKKNRSIPIDTQVSSKTPIENQNETRTFNINDYSPFRKPFERRQPRKQPIISKPKLRENGIDLAGVENYSFDYEKVFQGNEQTIYVYIYDDNMAYPLNDNEKILLEKFQGDNYLSNMLEIFSNNNNVYLFSNSFRYYHVLVYIPKDDQLNLLFKEPNQVTSKKAPPVNQRSPTGSMERVNNGKPGIPKEMPVYFKIDGIHDSNELYITKYEKEFASITPSDHVFSISPNKVSKQLLIKESCVIVICSIAYSTDYLNGNEIITQWYNEWSENQCRHRFNKLDRWMDDPKYSYSVMLEKDKVDEVDEWKLAYSLFFEHYKSKDKGVTISDELCKKMFSTENTEHNLKTYITQIPTILPSKKIYSSNQDIDTWFQYMASPYLPKTYKFQLPKVFYKWVVFPVRYNTVDNDVFGGEDKKVKFLHSESYYLKGGSVEKLLEMKSEVDKDLRNAIDLFYDFRECNNFPKEGSIEQVNHKNDNEYVEKVEEQEEPEEPESLSDEDEDQIEEEKIIEQYYDKNESPDDEDENLTF